MKHNESGPNGIVNQLELHFEEISPLSTAQRLDRWLTALESSELNMHSVKAVLYLNDDESRHRRARRWLEIRAVQAPYYLPSGWLVSGGSEAVWLYDEACAGYIAGHYLSSLLCAHAASERALAGLIGLHKGELSGSWSSWGLGKLIEATYNAAIIDTDLKERLARVNEARKVSAHYKPPQASNSVYARVLESLQAAETEIDVEEQIEDLIRLDALLSIEVATQLQRGSYGFG
ncbi:MAG: hypothetical protein M3443_03260 [Actinomycetota bacterium]|nr:hypothetical protein [Actinomycetota bacterium]